jgi:hypothetical protein
METNKNFEEFIGETLRTEELPGIVGGIETDDHIQQVQVVPMDADII